MEYRDFVNIIEINQINLSSLLAHKNEEFTSDQKDISVAMNYEEKKHDVKCGQFHVQFGLDVIALSAKIDIKESEILSLEDIDDNEILFRIEAVFDLSYNFKDIKNTDEFVKKNKQHVDTFCKKNVPINAWPYLREIIHSITVRMGLPQLTIPAFKRV